MINKINLSISYFFQIYRKSFSEVWGFLGMWGVVLNGIAIVASLAGKLFVGDIAALPIWLQEFDIWIFLFWFFLLATPFLALLNSIKVAALKDKEQQEKLSLKEYNDIGVEKYEYPWTDHQLSIGAGHFTNFLKVGLQVSNNGGIKVHCGLRMIAVQYNGRGSNNDWVPDPNPIEKKLLKWDEGYEIPDGKIDINPNGGVGRIFLAESNPYAMEFWFYFIDGKATNHHSLEGEYKVRIQLEGDTEKDGIKISLRPVLYDVLFKYERRKLLDVSVSKIREMGK